METGIVTPEMDRHNGRIFLLTYLLLYLAAPVMYVGIVQAALCDKLGAPATIANLPFAAYQFGQIAPLLCSWLVPQRLERAVVVWAAGITSALIGGVFLTLLFPMPATIRIGAVVAHGLLQGFIWSIAYVFLMQCLNRGTTEKGRARALQLTFSLGPLAAVLGSLGAQYILNPGLPALHFPFDFALVYGAAVPAVAGVAWLGSRFRLLRVEDQPRLPLLAFLKQSGRGFAASRALVLVWLGFLLWNCTLGAVANTSLYTKVAMGRDPKDFSGLILAIRFGCKALAGYGLGALAVRCGLRASALTTFALFAAGMIWTATVPGYAYLASFAFLGAGELGGVYIPNYTLSLGALAAGARNLAILNLATPVSSFAPALHGFLTDRFGFPSSFAFGLATALAGFWLLKRIKQP